MRTLLICLSLVVVGTSAHADTFTKADVAHWQAEFDASAAYGRQLWLNAAKFKLGTNGVACVQCHPNGANTHPETYPKYQKQVGTVVAMWQMINWCIRNPLQGKSLAPDSKEMVALMAYATKERAGEKLAPGKH